MIPGPRPTKGHDSPATGPAVALTRTARGWTVVSATGAEHADDLVEGMSLADLVAEEIGTLSEPDRTARRSARGAPATAADGDPADVRVAALERTIAQLEHALAARVSTERAIGVLAERHCTSVRVAFEALRRDARSQGRPVAELAREVLDSLADDAGPAAGNVSPSPSDSRPDHGRSVAAPAARRPGTVCVPVTSAPRGPAPAGSVTAVVDGRS